MGTAQAAEGWKAADGEWSYYDPDGQPVTLTWKKSKDSWYFLSENGTLLKHCIFRDKDSNYYVDDEGRMAQSAWIFVNADNGAGDEFEEGWYLFRRGRERAAGVRAADLKEKLETALIYLMKMEKCCQGGLMKMGI